MNIWQIFLPVAKLGTKWILFFHNYPKIWKMLKSNTRLFQAAYVKKTGNSFPSIPSSYYILYLVLKTDNH